MNSTDLYVTCHGELRSRKRKGISKKAVVRDAEKALDMGLGYADVKGKLKDHWIYTYEHCDNKANNIRFYNHYVYIFCDERLITVYGLDKKYQTYADKLQDKKLRLMIENENAVYETYKLVG